MERVVISCHFFLQVQQCLVQEPSLEAGRPTTRTAASLYSSSTTRTRTGEYYKQTVVTSVVTKYVKVKCTCPQRLYCTFKCPVDRPKSNTQWRLAKSHD